MGNWVATPQDLATRALHDIVLGIVPEPTQRHRASDRLGLGRNQRIDTATLKRAIDLGVGVASIGGDRLDVVSGGGLDFVYLRLDHLPFVRLSSRDRDVQNDADLVIHGGMLLVSRLQTPIASVRRHGRIGCERLSGSAQRWRSGAW
jgi:hypothetical protein